MLLTLFEQVDLTKASLLPEGADEDESIPERNIVLHLVEIITANDFISVRLFKDLLSSEIRDVHRIGSYYEDVISLFRLKSLYDLIINQIELLHFLILKDLLVNPVGMLLDIQLILNDEIAR